MTFSFDLFPDGMDHPQVCLRHGRHIPCRKRGPHVHSALDTHVALVRAYHADPRQDLTWQDYLTERLRSLEEKLHEDPMYTRPEML